MNERDDLIEHIVSCNLQVFQAMRSSQYGNWLDVDLTILQLKALFLLYTVDGLPMRRLAEGLGTSVTAITGLVDRLVEHELVRRDEDPEDRRLVIARLTEVGRGTIERLQEVKRDRFSRVLSRLNESELRIVAQAIDLLYQGVLAEVAAANCFEASRKA